MLYFTTSWDDGHILDRELSDMLSRYGVKGTFYVSKNYYGIGQMLSENDIREIARNHEVGAHTLTHPDLTKLARKDVVDEVLGSKRWLEDVVGKPVTLFCYPSGRYNEETISVVKEAGFIGARTISWPTTFFPAHPYEMATTLPIYPLPFRKLAGNRIWWRKALQPLVERYGRLRGLGVAPWQMYSWQSAARAAFDNIYEQGGVFHLWGHSWELENYGMWDELGSFLKYVTSKTEICFVANNELVKLTTQEVVILGEGAYGSWATSPKNLNEESIVYSFGVGEDNSWDRAMIKKFGMKVHAFDPSPKSIRWVSAQVGQHNFLFHPYGLSDHDGVDEFYPPPNPKNVSYSIAKKVGNPERLPVKCLQSVMREFGHDRIDVLKMDIEGSEYAVIDNLLSLRLDIPQILIEFHDRFAGRGKTFAAVRKICEAGYKILNVSKSGDEYTFVKR